MDTATDREKPMPWVVYEMTLNNNGESRNAVCEQTEWEEMELARPGYHKLLQSGIASEPAAERLARGNSGDAKPRQPRHATGNLGVATGRQPASSQAAH